MSLDTNDVRARCSLAPNQLEAGQHDQIRYLVRLAHRGADRIDQLERELGAKTREADILRQQRNQAEDRLRALDQGGPWVQPRLAEPLQAPTPDPAVPGFPRPKRSG